MEKAIAISGQYDHAKLDQIIKMDSKRNNVFGFVARTNEEKQKYKQLHYQANRIKHKKQNHEGYLRRKGQIGNRIKNCVICNTPFEITVKHGNQRKTCSEECRKKMRKLWSKTHNWGTTIDYRLLILHKLGAKCVQCGFKDVRALAIDHVNSDGAEKRRKINGSQRSCGYKYYRAVFLEIQAGSKDYQVLCANCNWIKRIERMEVNQWRKYYQKKIMSGNLTNG